MLPPARTKTAAAMGVMMALVMPPGVRAGQQPPPSAAVGAGLDELLTAASRYVSRFVEDFGNVIGEERYVQDVLPGGSLLSPQRRGGPGPTHRELRSDFMLVRTGAPLEWTAFRDTFEVDGAPVRDRDERLTRLFTQPSSDPLDQAARLAGESARFNIGPKERTVNSPVLPLQFLLPALRPRFRFSPSPGAADASARVLVVAYEETARPTIIRTTDDRDRPALGRFWIEPGTGRITQSELVLRGPGVEVRFTTIFQPDSRLGTSVPVRMREEYALPNERLVGVATYDGFRRFDVKTETNLDRLRNTP